MTKHPSETALALYSSGDLGSLRERVSTLWHVRTCERCAARVAAYRGDRALRAESAAAMPLPENWDALAEEMTANIRLGLSAAECVREVPAVAVPTAGRPGWYWKPAFGILGGMALVTVAMVTLQSEVFLRVWNRTDPTQVVVESSAKGVKVRSGSRSAIELTVGQLKPAQYSVNLDGSVRAQYVDDDSLQVTVTNVYAQ